MADKKTPIEQVTDLLAEMTARATEAERKLEEAERRASEWYKYHQAACKRIEELEDDLKRSVEYIESISKPTKKEREHNGKF